MDHVLQLRIFIGSLLLVSSSCVFADVDVALIKDSQQHYQKASEAINNGDWQTGRNEMEISVEKAEKGNMPAAGLSLLYYHFGSYLELTLEWNLAQQAFAKAVRTGELAHASPQKMVNLYYEYGRTSGIICQYDLAELNLKKAYALDEQQQGPTATDLFELALMHKAAGKLPVSLAEFTRAKTLMDQSGVEKSSPAQYAGFLTAYAATLQLAGQDSEAEALRQQARDLVGNTSDQNDTGLTPYGSQCGAASAK
jgi:tetratricopeptide (TPR) repeat protein